MNKIEVWQFQHYGLPVSVKHWGMEREQDFPPLNNGEGVWNYYVVLPERLLGEQFKGVWLPDRINFLGVTHDYYKAPFASVEWHGGVTYYEKHGHTGGHRSVEIGCDFNHLFDHERSCRYTLEEVVAEAKQTAGELATLFGVKQ